MFGHFLALIREPLGTALRDIPTDSPRIRALFMIELNEQQKIEITELYNSGKLDGRQLSKKYSVPWVKIKRYLLEKDIKEWTSQSDLTTKTKENLIIHLYANKNHSLNAIARNIGVGVPFVKNTLIANSIQIKTSQDFLKSSLTEEEERQVVADYVDSKMKMSQVCANFKIRQNRFYEILKKYGHGTRDKMKGKRILPLEQELSLCQDYQNNNLCKIEIEEKYNIGWRQVDRIFKEYGIETNRSLTFNKSNRRPFLEIWTEKYGKERADELWKIYLKKASKAVSGENNPMYGKPSPQGSGHGWKGWFNGLYCRSLREMAYLIHLTENNISWASAEKKEFTINYTNWNGKNRTYRPDFIIEGKTLVEIKPKRLQKSPIVILKKAAAEKFCAANGYKYELIDFSINPIKIKEYLEKGIIKFDRDYEKKFYEYIAKKTRH